MPPHRLFARCSQLANQSYQPAAGRLGQDELIHQLVVFDNQRRRSGWSRGAEGDERSELALDEAGRWCSPCWLLQPSFT